MEDFEKLYNKALRYLSYRSRSEKEVRERLKKAKAPENTIKEIISRLKEYNFLNDLEFAKSWIAHRSLINPKSTRVIKMELKQKGISDEVVESLKLKGENDLELAKNIIEKKLKTIKHLPKKELQNKLFGFLARRGFDYDVIKKSVDEILNKGV